MEPKKCNVFNHGVLLSSNMEFIDRPPYLIVDKKVAELPDSDALTLEDEDGYRYKRCLIYVSASYIFEHI